ncbi:FkbM family methyltransferase [Pedobacter rhodius]|uniref:FkbM family methyltransferase n=1 Tax=Pedobacter rhodius TaxID=3004098 RepID=A0ABT4KS98_9SPHI|nr:FkbM family methyltransferase [Pedobacter sp. SJ11]MCZ4221795.1 FkbM family methyltransferase [Pedobacter sp. SJ11]
MKLGVPNQESSFLRLKKLGFNPERIIDIGAFEGMWSQDIHLIFPKSQILMVEGQKNKENILTQKLKSIPNSTLKIALLGAEKKNVAFNIYESASSIFEEDNKTNAKVEHIELNLLDEVAFNAGFETADLIKLDTQGSELEILKGGEKVLQTAQLVLVEVSLLQIYKGAPLVDEVINFMKDRGFVLYDICSVMRRPYDKALFQSDFLFIKQQHPLIASSRWA